MQILGNSTRWCTISIINYKCNLTEDATDNWILRLGQWRSFNLLASWSESIPEFQFNWMIYSVMYFKYSTNMRLFLDMISWKPFTEKTFYRCIKTSFKPTRTWYKWMNWRFQTNFLRRFSRCYRNLHFKFLSGAYII